MKKLYLILLVLFTTAMLVACDGNQATGPYREGVYYAVDPETQVSAHIVIDESGNISHVMFDKPYQNTTLQTLGDEFMLESDHSWKEEANYLGSYLALNQGWDDIELIVTDITGETSFTVPDYFIEIDYLNSPSDIQYVTIPVDGFVLSWNLAIAKAASDGSGIIENVPTSQDWVEANKPPYDYIDGTYTAADEEHGYITRIVIENGYIVDVVFDAITAINTRIVWNDNNTPGDPSDDYPQVEIISMSTKQALGDDLVLVSGTPWYVEAELMRAYIIDKQGWDENWVYTVSAGHEYFNFTDDFTLDSVAGVTLAVEGFRTIFLEAIEQAIPEE